ncbi:MAG: hypothetical protein ACRD0K_24720 [Egibacteraceae bacterium]
MPDLGPVRAHDGLVLVAVGRLNAQKGFDVLLTAPADLPEVRLADRRLRRGGRRAGGPCRSAGAWAAG